MSTAPMGAQAGTRVPVVLARRWWLDTRYEWPSLEVQALFVEPAPEPGSDAHAGLVEWDEETRGWALLALAEADMDPAAWSVSVALMDWAELSPEARAALPCAPNASPQPSALFSALDRVEDQQRELQYREAARVIAAVAAWRVALVEEGRPGAVNTPYQRGFFLDLGAKLRVAESTARTLVHTAARLERDLPLVWAHFTAGRVPWRAMQMVHTVIDGLDDTVLPAFDAAAVVKLDQVLITSLPDSLRRLAERLQPSTADERHERANTRRRYHLDPAADGMGWLHLYLPMADLLAMDHQVTKQAIAAHGQPGEQRGIAALKADVLRDGLRSVLRRDHDPVTEPDALVPGRRGVEPRVGILIPALTALGHATAPAVLQGYGPIGITTALRLAGNAKAWVRVLTDPFTGAILNIGREKYRPTEDMRTLIRFLDGGTRGPSRPRGPDDGDFDHNQSYWQDDEHGETAIDNLVLLSRTDHGAKTAGDAKASLLLDRTQVWETPSGNKYVTRPHDPPEATPVPPELIDPDDCPF